jgi:hypothetical protein
MAIIQVFMRMAIRIACPWVLVWQVLVRRELAVVVLRQEDVVAPVDVAQVVVV